MCCLITVKALPTRLEEVLAIAGFSRVGNDQWERQVDPESGVRVGIIHGYVRLSIWPMLIDKKDHYRIRHAAAIAFKVASTLAEESEATVYQEMAVTDCSEGLGPRLLASYPEQPLVFERICPGFQKVILQPS